MSILSDLINNAAGLTCDSRCVKPGYIFVAIRGRATDGNLFTREAEKRGAIAVVTEEQAPELTIPVITVPNARKALAELAARFYSFPADSMSVIGVTGTNGKTTITYMLEHIFAQAGFKPGIIGTVRVNTGRHTFPSRLTTPDAVTTNNYLAQMRTNGVSHVAMEVSAQGVEMHRVDTIKFSCGILSNISPDHLDFHGNFANYLAAKKQFLKLLGPSSAPLIINNADRLCYEIGKAFSGRLITVAVDQPADISASVKSITAYSSRFEISTSALTDINGQQIASSRVQVQLPLTGRHNIENAVLAAAAALLHGVPLTIISAALSNIRSVERRMNIFHMSGRTIIDDTALNPASINAVFNSVSAFRPRSTWVINAIRGGRGPAINDANAAAIAAWQEKLGFSLIVTSSIGSVSKSDIVTLEEKIAFLSALDSRQSKYTYFSSLNTSLTAALKVSGPSDLLILLGAQGMDDARKILTSLVLSLDCLPQLDSPDLVQIVP